MPGATPKNYSPKKTQAIFEAAKHQFLQQGFKGATMEAIAIEAGVSKQTLYNRYPDKQSLFVGILQQLVATIDHEADKPLPPITKLDDVRELLFGLAREIAHTIANPEYLSFMRVILPEFHNYPELKDLFRQKMPDRIIATLTQIFKIAADKDIIAVQNPEIPARMFAGAMLTYILQRGVLGASDEVMISDTEINDVVQQIVAMVNIQSDRIN